MKKTLKVFAADNNSLVTDINALNANIRRFVGRHFDEIVYGWVPNSEPSIIEYKHEYIEALKKGYLLPADEATAKLAGLKF